MILNYLLAVSVLVLSVIKTSELFIQSDQALTKLQKQFIDQTRKTNHLKNEDGSISLTAAVLTSLLSSLLLFYSLKMKIEYKEAVYRKKSYLCVHYLNTQTQKYIEEMSKFNIALRSAFIAQSTESGGIAAAALFKALTIARNTRHLYYISIMSKNNNCELVAINSYFINWPLQTKAFFILNTNIDETTILTKSNWTNNYFQFPEGIRWKNSFLLKSTYTINGNFYPHIMIETEELSPPVL